MDWFVKAFIKASLAWLALAVSLGIAMAAHPAWTVHRTAHLHLALLGFVTMMIFGVALWLFPRPAKDDTRYTPRAATAAYWLITIGVFFYTMWQRIRPAGSQTREAQGQRF